MISIGFTIAFKMANDIATKKADRKSSTLTPGKSQAEISTANVDRNILPRLPAAKYQRDSRNHNSTYPTKPLPYR